MNYDITQPGSYVRDKRTGQHYTVIARIDCGNTPTDDIVLRQERRLAVRLVLTTGCSLSKFLEGYEAATPGTYERGSLQPADDSAPRMAIHDMTWPQLLDELRRVRVRYADAQEAARKADAYRAAVKTREESVLSRLATYIPEKQCFVLDGVVFTRTTNGPSSTFVFTEHPLAQTPAVPGEGHE